MNHSDSLSKTNHLQERERANAEQKASALWNLKSIMDRSQPKFGDKSGVLAGFGQTVDCDKYDELEL